MTRLRLVALACLLSGGASCRTTKPVGVTEFPELPNTGASHFMRGVVALVPGGRRLAVHGNYGGPGNHGGPPKDLMDEYFRQHDLEYTILPRMSALRESDRRLLARLESLGELPDPDCEAYRQRAIRYFRRPMSRLVGKPIAAWFGWTPRAGDAAVRWHMEYSRRIRLSKASGRDPEANAE